MPYKMLVADNNHLARIGLASILKSEYPDITIDVTGNYKELKKKLLINTYHIVFLDPTCDIRFIKKISRLKLLQQTVKILLFTDYKMDKILQNAQDIANGYLSKKSNESEIKAAVDSILEKGFFYSQEKP